MVKCENIKLQLKKQIATIYGETISMILDERRGGLTRPEVTKRIGSLDDIVNGICFAIEITTEQWHKPEIWLDENGRLKRQMVIDHIFKQFDEYEERMEAKREFEVEARCNRD